LPVELGLMGHNIFFKIKIHFFIQNVAFFYDKKHVPRPKS
jgi:hypothetical protein